MENKFKFMLINDNKIFFFIFNITYFNNSWTNCFTNKCIINCFFIFFCFFKNKHYKFLFKDKTICLLLIICIYLIFNSLISINYEVGLNRNFGFIRFLFFFIAINYFFYISQKNLKIINIWTVFIIIFATDVYFERFFGANIFGWGAYEINNIKQPHGTRVMSFLKMNLLRELT